jgi:hypothetical protein
MESHCGEGWAGSFQLQGAWSCTLFPGCLQYGKMLYNAAVADRIVGLAVAMLCLYARITSVYADTASQGALDMLLFSRLKSIFGDSNDNGKAFT